MEHMNQPFIEPPTSALLFGGLILSVRKEPPMPLVLLAEHQVHSCGKIHTLTLIISNHTKQADSHMNILVINCGSSSVKINILDAKTGQRLFQARVERIGSDNCTLSIAGDKLTLPNADHSSAIEAVLTRAPTDTVKAVGHRVVHGGEQFSAPTRIDTEVEQAIESLSTLAPLHNPANLAGIHAAKKLFPDLPHVAVFDTAFHQTLPKRAYSYAIPSDLQKKHGLRRYGFHGTSHSWVARKAADALQEDIQKLRIITCHLGNGCSITAVEHGRSIETSMGMGPLEGLVMGTRSGDIDPCVLLELQRKEGLSTDEVDLLLNTKSGLLGLSGVSNDMRDIDQLASEGDEACRLAIRVFCHRLRKYIGAYAAVMGGVDAIVFTAGIGENSAWVRDQVTRRLDFLGIRLDDYLNRAAKVDQENPVAVISADHSRAKILVVATDEAHAIARATEGLVKEKDKVDSSRGIPVAVSARHIHLTQEAVEVLFGKGHQLTPLKELSQPKQYACEERLTIIGPKRSIEKVRILGPVRSKCQVEISRTDEYTLGIDAPIRASSHVEHSPGATLEGPHGSLVLEQGIICAQRHIHMRPEDAEYFGVKNKDIVEVAMDTNGRDLIFGDVLVRVSDKYILEMHIDTDEANAAEISSGQTSGVLVQTQHTATLKKRAVDS